MQVRPTLILNLDKDSYVLNFRRTKKNMVMDGIDIFKKIIAGMISQVQIFLDLKQINVTSDLLYAVIQHVIMDSSVVNVYISLMNSFFTGHVGCKIFLSPMFSYPLGSLRSTSIHILQPSRKE